MKEKMLLKNWVCLFMVVAFLWSNHVESNSADKKNVMFANPRDTLKELRSSLVERREDRFLNCFVSDKSQIACLKEIFRRVQTVWHLRDIIEKMYGHGAWEIFQAGGKQVASHPQFTPDVIPIDEKKWDYIEIHNVNGKVSFFNPSTQSTNIMFQYKEQWKVDAGSSLGSVEYAKLARYLKLTSDAIEEVATELEKNKPALKDVGFILFDRVSRKRGSQ